MKKHHYKIQIEWTGNLGAGTKNYTAYNRNHTIMANGKYSELQASSDPSFSGDATRYNPEELFLSSLSSCHMLWYLHLCAINDIVVIEYIDHATGVMEETGSGSGRFIEVTLHPQVKITDDTMTERAYQLHDKANKMCFIANSCNFEIKHMPLIFTG